MKKSSHLKSDEVHVWINHYSDSDQLIDKTTSLLSPSEIQRANLFHFSEDRKRYIQAHAFLRLVLGEYTDIQPHDMDFEIGAHGKPHLLPENLVFFNLSHTKEIIAVAVSLDRNVGIDIEIKEHVNDIENVARQFMSATELKEMSRLEAGLRNSYFHQCWVNKEALVKASGRGIDDSLRLISVMAGSCNRNTRIISSFCNGKRRTWRLDSFDIPPDHLGAVCVETTLGVMDHSIKFSTKSLLHLFEASSYGIC